MFEPISLVEAARQIRAGRLTPSALLERCLGQIDRYEDRVHAWVLVDEANARRAAEEAGQAIARGEYRGPLHGVPVGIKDIVDVAGLPTRAGSPLRENHVARSDAPLVTALRRAGAVILGKTVTVEFACFDPSPTRNPWDADLEHSPGGSSSGSAVAVALGMCPGTIGTQTGGSLVRPASYCGIATCKPTFGRVNAEGIVPVSHHLDHPGPMARCVADLEIMLRYLPGTLRFGRTTGPAATQDLSDGPAAASRPPRLGLVEQFFLDEADEAIQRATETAVATLRDGGAVIDRVALPEGFAEILSMHERIMAVEAAAYHRETFAAHRASYGPMITGLLDRGLKIAAVDYAAALAHQRDFRRRIGPLLEGFDALLMPATDTTAPPTLATTGNKRNQAPWSYLGVPVVSIPCGLASDGMPAAVQLVGRHDREAALFRVAGWCEERLDFRTLPPLLEQG